MSMVIEGAKVRLPSKARRQENVQRQFLEQSAEFAALGQKEAESYARWIGYDGLEQWFEAKCETFRGLGLAIPERPGWLRDDEWDQDGVLELRQQIGRKFDATDMTVGLKKFATAWLRSLGADESFEYLANLRWELVENGRKLSDGQAKGVLNSLVARVAREKARDAGREKAGLTKSDDRITEDGMYRTEDGTIYKVQFNRADGDGKRLYAKQLVVERDAVRDADGNIVEGAKVRFDYAKGAVYKLRAQDKMTLEEAKAFGALYGTCCNCGRTLTNEESIELGIGPVCRKGFEG